MRLAKANIGAGYNTKDDYKPGDKDKRRDGGSERESRREKGKLNTKPL